MTAERSRDLASFRGVFARLEANGIEATVIGGIAVGYYAAAIGEPTLSADLDLYVSDSEQKRLERLALQIPGVQIKHRPQPRSLGVLVLDWRGVEVDALTRSEGLPPPEQAFRDAWAADSDVHVLDPFALLQNKLRVRRPKDEPHIRILETFLRDYVVGRFGQIEKPKADRLQPARLFLNVLDLNAFPPDLFDLLTPLACDSASRAFLVQHAPTSAAAEQVIAGAPATEQERLRRIASRPRGH